MKQLINIFLVIGLFLFVGGCDENSGDTPEPVDEGTGIFELNITTRVSGESFVPEVVYKNIQGRSYFINRFDMYISNVTLIDEMGNEEVLSTVELFDLTNPGLTKIAHGEGTFVQYEVPAKKYQGVKFSIGVPDSLNHADPSDFPPDHPLNTLSTMHWSWATGYRFMVIEGKIDSSVTADGNSFDRDLVYHTGLDTLYRELSFTKDEHSFTVPKDEELQFIVELDLNRLFYTESDTIDMVNENITHTMPPGSKEYRLAEKITNNLVEEAIFKVPF